MKSYYLQNQFDMLRTTLLALIILFFCDVGITQSSFSRRYHAVTVGFGPRILDTTTGTILATYVDDSPSMDNFSTTTEVLDKYSRVGINVGYSYGQTKGLSHSLDIDIAFGKNQGIVFYYSLGYSFSKVIDNKSLVIQPALNIGFGDYGFDIGEIENNASYIQIGNDQYFSESLDLDLNAKTFIFGPALDFHYLLGDFKIFANVAYDIASGNSNPKLVFKAREARDDGQQSRVDIDGDNPLVTFNEDRIKSLPYEASGIRTTFGVGYLWSR